MLSTYYSCIVWEHMPQRRRMDLPCHSLLTVDSSHNENKIQAPKSRPLWASNICPQSHLLTPSHSVPAALALFPTPFPDLVLVSECALAVLCACRRTLWTRPLQGWVLLFFRSHFICQSLPSGSFHKPLFLLCQRADRMKTTITENYPTDHMDRSLV